MVKISLSSGRPLPAYLRHIFPINGQYTAMGNDFILLYYKYKVYLLACLADFELLFGTFKPVRLTLGRHRVRFCYQPGLI
ncbi:MAG TPA: hypothetical protein HPP66_12565 [Planctomycetes bacterium]|nr:hypothetical protein [Planctomycetota bacterium]